MNISQMMLSKSLFVADRITTKAQDIYRTTGYVFMKITEEIVEIYDEIQILKSGGEQGKDGITGEVIDTMISLIDLQILTSKNPEDVKKMAIEGLRQKTLKNATIDSLHGELLSLNGRISVAIQVYEGISYKKPADFGFDTGRALLHSLIYEMLQYCLGILDRTVLMVSRTSSEIDAKQQAIETIWENKTNKWLEKRTQ